MAMRLKIPNIDRVGLVLDISRLLADQQINIVSMEVELKTIYLEVESRSLEATQEMLHHLQDIAGVIAVIEIDLMPHQEKSEQLKAVLTAVSDGIVGIDHQARVTQYNPAAEKILHIPIDVVIGNYLTDIFPDNMVILDALHHGATYNNKEIILKQTNSHFLTSGRPIIDQSGHIIGAVAILKDISDVRELVHTVTSQLPLTFQELTCTSKAMQQVISLAKTYARGDSTVLIRGETGTGKELFARAIHAASPRNNKIFLPINCAAIPDTLLESELFGYEEGAFTGAVRGGKPGLFELANEGTLFLDEIGEISPHLQAKLLRVLQDKKVRRIGSTCEVAVNVRILAATNRNLEEMIVMDKFREDLYYRLNVIPLFIPPLRDHRDDIPPLVKVFLQRFAIKLQKSVDEISETALHRLMQHTWPGNIRELENVIERAVNIVNGSIILSDQIILCHNKEISPPIQSEKQTLREILDETEREILQTTLRKYHTSRQLGAVLGISHTAVLKKLQKYGLSCKNHSANP